MKTFVVRLAEVDPGPSPARKPGDGTLRGVVDEVSTGDRTPFRNAEELVALLETAVETAVETAPETAPETAAVESRGRRRW